MPADTAYHDALGDHFARIADTSPYNAYTDRPAMLRLAGDVAGLRILDVACGAGHYSAELEARGATVVGVDGSPTLLGHARSRLGEQVELHQHDLEQPLDFAGDASFDAALCALAIHHIANRTQLLSELRRVIRPGGRLLISTTHPAADWRHFGDSYYSEEWVESAVGEGSLSINYQRMSLETFIGELLAAGFVLERLVEPRPDVALRDIDEVAYERLLHRPCFLAVRLIRP